MALTLAVGGLKGKPSPPPTPARKGPAPAATRAVSFSDSPESKAKHAPPPMQGRRPPDFSLLGALDKHLFKTRNEPNSRSRGVFHPSEIDGCKRYLALDYIKAPMTRANLDARIYRIFENGEGVHYRIQKYLRELAGTYGIRAFFKKEAPTYNPEWEIDGSTDGVWSLDGYCYIIEIKSINQAGFDKLRKPEAKHVRQVNRYMGALGVQAAIFIYESKNTQEWKEFRVDFDPESWQETCRIVDYVRTSVRTNVLPPKEESSACKGCKFFQHCIKENLSDETFFNNAILAGGRP